MKRVFPVALFLFIVLLSCSKDKSDYNADNFLIGTWTFSSYQDDISVFDRTVGFSDNRCYKFNTNGTLIERKNSGFCGTPPITYADYPGTWEIISDTLIQITVGSWNGETKYTMAIESIDLKSFRARIIYEQ